MKKLVLAGAALALACQSAPQPTQTPDAKLPAVELAGLDRSVNPCDDFYQFACGGWIASHPVPKDRAIYGRGFTQIADRNELALRQILEDDAAGKLDPADPYAQKVGDFYGGCMDEGQAENGALARLQARLAEIDAIHDGKGLARAVAALQLEGVNALFGLHSEQDAKDATRVIAAAGQGGMGLPDRDFYLLPARKKALDLYRTYVKSLASLAGADDAEAEQVASAVLQIETTLAKAALDKVSLRDPYKVYHLGDGKALAQRAPGFDWKAYFSQVGVDEAAPLNVSDPGFFEQGVNAVVASAGLPAIKRYLRFHLISAAVPALPQRFLEARFTFISPLTGQKELAPRWKRCVGLTDGSLQDAVGRSFVARTMGEAGTRQARQMVEGIEAAFDQNLKTLDWMDPATRAQATAKLHKITNQIAHPPKFRSYDALTVNRADFLGSLFAARAHEVRHLLSRIGQPVDREEWEMSVSEVNAYYDPALNGMVFLAGILQPPFFSADAPAVANFGGIGTVMGHELTHGFDDQGSQYDGDGNLREWWSQESSARYREGTGCVANQYDQYEAAPGQKLNGKLTLGENIADIGGLKLARSAYHQSRGDRAAPMLGGLTEDQQFYVAFAQAWCANVRPEAARLQAQTNEHSTPQWRVNGSVSDTPDFARAFACPAGSPMAPKNRCTVW